MKKKTKTNPVVRHICLAAGTRALSKKSERALAEVRRRNQHLSGMTEILAKRFHRIGASKKDTRLAWECVLVLLDVTGARFTKEDLTRYL